MKKSKIILILLSWTVPFAPAIIYALAALPPLVTQEQGWSVSIGLILLLLVIGPLFLSKQKMIKSRTIIFGCLFLGFLMIEVILSQLVWMLGLTTLGVGLDESIIQPLLRHMEGKEDVK